LFVHASCIPSWAHASKERWADGGILAQVFNADRPLLLQAIDESELGSIEDSLEGVVGAAGYYANLTEPSPQKVGINVYLLRSTTPLMCRPMATTGLIHTEPGPSCRAYAALGAFGKKPDCSCSIATTTI
jgi:hypothetical protein